jgi:hypothetical protein
MLIKDKQFVKKKTTRSLHVVYTKIMIPICSHWHFPTSSPLLSSAPTQLANKAQSSNNKRKYKQSSIYILVRVMCARSRFRVKHFESIHQSALDDHHKRGTRRKSIDFGRELWINHQNTKQMVEATFSRCENIDLFLRHRTGVKVNVRRA